MAIEDPEIINAVTKQLYPSVAKQYETTSSRVERAILQRSKSLGIAVMWMC